MYRRVFGAAGKGHSALLTAGVGVGAVEVDVQIPVISSKSSTTLPLQGQKRHTHTHTQEFTEITRAKGNNGAKRECDSTQQCAHVFLGEVYQVLQIDVVSVGPNVIVNEKVELVLDPVFEDKGQDSCSQLQEEDDTQEDGELKGGTTAAA